MQRRSIACSQHPPCHDEEEGDGEDDEAGIEEVPNNLYVITSHVVNTVSTAKCIIRRNSTNKNWNSCAVFADCRLRPSKGSVEKGRHVDTRPSRGRGAAGSLLPG